MAVYEPMKFFGWMLNLRNQNPASTADFQAVKVVFRLEEFDHNRRGKGVI
jgi:hypothetical protein